MRLGGCEWQVGATSNNDCILLHLKCLSTERTSRKVPTSFKFSIIKQDGSEGLSGKSFVIFGPNFVDFNITSNSASGSINKKDMTSCFTIKVGLSPHTAKFRDAALGACSLPDVDGVKPDLKIIVGGHQIQAHRFVLAHKSKYFQGLVFPVTDEPLRLDDCDYAATCTAIRFMYTGECIVNSDNLREVLLIGFKFGLNNLLLSCLDLLSPENAALFALFIGQVSELPTGKNIPTSPTFSSDFWKYISNNIAAIVEGTTIRSLTVEEIIWFTGRPEVKAKGNPKDLKNVLLTAQMAELTNPPPAAATRERLIKARKFCVVCQEKIPEQVIEPCGHLCLCRECGDKLKQKNLKKCPVCQEQFINISKVHFP